MKQVDRDALRYWEELKQSVYNATTIDETMTQSEIERHRMQLESDPLTWFLFFFPQYAKYPFAPFQVRAVRRVLAHPEWFEVRSWSRELAKSTIGMFEDLYLALTRRKRFFVMASNTREAAVRLLMPYRAELEANRRIKQYYGDQPTLGEMVGKLLQSPLRRNIHGHRCRGDSARRQERVRTSRRVARR